MEQVAPLGPVYQAGTLSGNPVAVAAGIETLRILRDDESVREARGVHAAGWPKRSRGRRAHGVPMQINRVGSMMTAFFTDQPVTDYATAKTSDTQRYAAFFRGMLERGIYLAASQFEAAFVSTAHTDDDIARTIEAAERVLSLGRQRLPSPRMITPNARGRFPVPAGRLGNRSHPNQSLARNSGEA